MRALVALFILASVSFAQGGPPTSSAPMYTKAGIFRQGFLWVEDVNGDISPNPRVFGLGGIMGNNPDVVGNTPPFTNDIPLTGNWPGTSWLQYNYGSVGIFRPVNGLFILDTNGDGLIDSGDEIFFLGNYNYQPGDIPVTGDWNGDGSTKVGIYRPAGSAGSSCGSSTGEWFLDYYHTESATRTYCYGYPGDVPVVGNWTNSPTHMDQIGVVHSGYLWILDSAGQGQMNSSNLEFGWGGIPGDVPVVGQWGAPGATKAGVFRQGFLWLLDTDGSHTQDSSTYVFGYGGIAATTTAPGDVPVVANWNPLATPTVPPPAPTSVSITCSGSACSSSPPGNQVQFTFAYTDQVNGANALHYGQVWFADSNNNKYCQLEWGVNNQIIQQDPQPPGPFCTATLATIGPNSYPDPGTLNVTLTIAFNTSMPVGTFSVVTAVFDADGNESPFGQVGSFSVNTPSGGGTPQFLPVWPPPEPPSYPPPDVVFTDGVIQTYQHVFSDGLGNPLPVSDIGTCSVSDSSISVWSVPAPSIAPYGSVGNVNYQATVTTQTGTGRLPVTCTTSYPGLPTVSAGFLLVDDATPLITSYGPSILVQGQPTNVVFNGLGFGSFAPPSLLFSPSMPYSIVSGNTPTSFTAQVTPSSSGSYTAKVVSHGNGPAGFVGPNSNVSSSQNFTVAPPTLTSLTESGVLPGTSGGTMTLAGQGLTLPTDSTNTVYQGVTGVSFYNSSGQPQSGISGTITMQTSNTVAVAVSVASTVAVGTYNVAVTAFGVLTNTLPFTISDQTPTITAIVIQSLSGSVLQTLPQNGQAWLELYGANFGQSGSVSICAAGASPCSSSDISAAPPAYWSNGSASAPAQVNILVTTSATSSGQYDVQLTSAGWTGVFFQDATGQNRRLSNRVQARVGTGPRVRITSRPFNLDTNILNSSGKYVAHMTSQATNADGSPATGTYAWTTSNPGNAIPTSASASATDLGIGGPGDATTPTTVTLTFTDSTTGLTVHDSLTFLLTDHITVVGWIDASAISYPSIPSGSPWPGLLSVAQTCGFYSGLWSSLGAIGQVSVGPPLAPSAAEAAWIDAWLNIHSSNSPLPGTISGQSVFSQAQTYRSYHNLQLVFDLSDGTRYAPFQWLIRDGIKGGFTGVTPEPCSGLRLFSLPGQVSPRNSSSPTYSPDGYSVYMEAEVRVGQLGQDVNYYLNGDSGHTNQTITPWSWAVISFPASGGRPVFTQGTSQDTLQIYPSFVTYYRFYDGNSYSYSSFGQAALPTYIPLDANSYYRPQ